jgi:hypothetical protein
MLALATSAAAECAWVLWERLTGPSGIDHSIVAARSSEPDCRALVQPTVRRRVAVVGTPGPGGERPRVTIEGDSVVVLRSEEGRLSWAYTCLPDTVDPRGPKGTR